MRHLKHILTMPDPILVRRTVLSDLGFIVLGMVIAMALLWYAGRPLTGIMCFAAITVSLAAVRTVAARIGARPEEACSLARVTLALAILTSGSIALPGLLLTSHESMTFMLLGYIWLFGVQLYIAGAYQRLPIFSLAMSLPVVAAMIYALFRIIEKERFLGDQRDYPVLVGMAAFYTYAIWIILARQAGSDAFLKRTRQEAEAKVNHLLSQNRRDGLTGLLNSTAIDKDLEDRLTRKGAHEVAVFVIDMSFVRQINSTYGHGTGDIILRVTADRLTKFFGDRATIGRLSGDSFIAVLSFEGEETPLVGLARNLSHALEQPVRSAGYEFAVTAPIGIATTLTVSERSVSTLCSAADSAAQRARNGSDQNPFLYDPKAFRTALSPEDRRLLIQGLEDGTVQAHYQPKVHLETGQIVGMEALARWHHPTRGIQSPGAFLPDIEALGLQGRLMECIVSQVLADVGKLSRAGVDPGHVAINIPELALATTAGRARLNELLRSAADLRGHITLEMTEDVFIARAPEKIRDATVAFRAMGLRIALDDFGTGFASFNHLKQLQFDELKIDRNFINDLITDPRNEVLLQSLIGIASGLGVSVIAEGVETEEQRNALLQLGCFVAQGFLFSPAIPFDELAPLMRQMQAEVERKGVFTPFAAGQPLAGPAARERP